MQPEGAKDKAKAILDQHRGLSSKTQRIVGILTTSFDWDHLEEELSGLFDLLGGHFELEEHGGYMLDVRRVAPNEEPAVAELLAAHESLRGILSDVRTEAHQRRDAEDVRHRFLTWMDELSRHEEAENRLVRLAHPDAS